jgi:hypothetical protein
MEISFLNKKKSIIINYFNFFELFKKKFKEEINENGWLLLKKRFHEKNNNTFFQHKSFQLIVNETLFNELISKWCENYGYENTWPFTYFFHWEVEYMYEKIVIILCLTKRININFIYND